MAKYSGNIGYVETVETSPSVYMEKASEHKAFGDILQYRTSWQNGSDSTNDNITISNRISIVADEYAYTHFQYIRYAVINGARWKVTSAEKSDRRIILTIGGVYNGKTPET